jgi:uncharacterized protein YjiK
MPFSVRGARIALLCGAVAAFAACDAKDGKTARPDASALARRAETFARKLASPDSDGQDGGAIARWIMPNDLKEISGLALMGDGRLFGFGDEHAHVFEIDFRRGVIVKEFALAEKGKAVKGDVEGLTIAPDGTMYMLESGGTLFAFKEGKDSATVSFTVYDTGLKDECEFEGVAFDKTLDALLLACKKISDKKLKDAVVIFRWKLTGDTARAARISHLSVPMADAIGSNEWDGLHPSDITIDPFTGDYILVASREKAILEITPAGKVVFSRPLPGVHDQAEGVAVTRDSLLIVSDEAAARKADPVAHPHRVADDPSQHRPAFLTVYRWP